MEFDFEQNYDLSYYKDNNTSEKTLNNINIQQARSINKNSSISPSLSSSSSLSSLSLNNNTNKKKKSSYKNTKKYNIEYEVENNDLNNPLIFDKSDNTIITENSILDSNQNIKLQKNVDYNFEKCIPIHNLSISNIQNNKKSYSNNRFDNDSNECRSSGSSLDTLDNINYNWNKIINNKDTKENNIKIATSNIKKSFKIKYEKNNFQNDNSNKNKNIQHIIDTSCDINKNEKLRTDEYGFIINEICNKDYYKNDE